MKKALLAAIISTTMATSAVFGQHTQSVAFTGPASWTPGTMITLAVNLTYAGYTSPGYSLWLEVNNAVAPFLSIVSHTNLAPFNDPNNVNPKPALFNLTMGATAGFMAEGNDQGATTSPLTFQMPGTYHVADITFMLDAGAPTGMFTLASTTLTPKISEVSDSDFNDNPIPRGTFAFTIVPEPSTFALIGVGAVVSGMLAYRRRKTTR